MTLEARKLSAGYGEHVVLPELSLTLERGTATALVGANGSGKSTLLRVLSRLLPPRSGAVYLDGKAIHLEPTKEVARKLAFLPQRGESPEGLTVEELVSQGRFPHRGPFGGLSAADREAIARAISVVALENHASRPVELLSGGERQRAFIAMALAQETELLLLDEPTTFLDLKHQLEVLELVAKLHREQQKTVVMVLHDLNLAARYARRMVAIKQGKISAQGSPDEVMRPEVLREVFGIEAEVIRDPRFGTPHCLAYAG